MEKLFTLLPPVPLHHLPGQFVQVSLPGFTEAPISISSSPTRGGYIELGVRRAGALTAAMHGLAPGMELGIRGPFGAPFAVDRMMGNDLLLVAGGCGLLPMRSLIHYCEDHRDRFGAITVLYGAKNPEELLFKEELDAWRDSSRLTCRIAVQHLPNGSAYTGRTGLITPEIESLPLVPENTIAVIVGPPAMYQPAINRLRAKGVRDDRICVSLERNMRCGVGKCGHCAIESLYCCVDGPVFWLPEIVAVRGAL